MKHPYLPKLLFLLLFVCAGFTSALAQTGSVSGRIVDEKSQGLPGVTVLIEGSTLGTSTNSDGQYSIQNVPAGSQTIVASFVGFTTTRRSVNVTAGQNSALDINLVENTTLLNEAVVIGYGTQRRQDLTGAIEQVSEKQFVKGQITNPEQLVQGKVAGLQVTTTGGAPGAGSALRIRGGSSLNASNDPLVIIDGVPVDNRGLAGAANPLSLINPSDIESVTVLKDASSTAIYGSRASNGVILVTTKKGLDGEKLTVNFSSQNSTAEPVKYVDVLTGSEFRALVNSRGSAQQKALLGSASTDWQREIYRNAQTTDNNLSLTGSLGKLPFRISGGYLDQEGLLIDNDLKRYSGSVALNPTLLNGSLKVNVNYKGSVIDNRFSNGGAINAAVNYDPTQPIFRSGAEFARYGGYFEFLGADGFVVPLAPRNPVSLIKQSSNTSTVKRHIGNVQLDYKLPFLSGLSANLNLGMDLQEGKGNDYRAPTTGELNGGRAGRNNDYRQNNNNRLLEALLKYNKELGGNPFDLLAGYSYQKFDYREYVVDDRLANGQLFQQPADRPITGKEYYDPAYVLISFFGRANYNIAEKYLFTGSFRADGSSRFPDTKRWGYFPSAAVAWRVKGEDFLSSSSTVSDLKFRLGYGQTGQQDIGTGINGLYGYQTLYTPGRNTAQTQIGNEFITTYRPELYDGERTWETTTTYNAGVDYGFFDGRVSGSIDVYKRDTKDLLNFINVAAGANLSNAGFFNVGELTNKGAEAVLNIDLVRGDKFTWAVNANGNINRSKITKLNVVDNPNYEGVFTGGIAGAAGQTIQINSVGYQPNAFYVYQQVYDANGKPLEGVVVDRNGDGIINGSDRYRYKSARPTAILGFGSNLGYGKASLAFTMRSNLNNYVYNNLRANANFNATATNPFLYNVNREILFSGFTSGATTVQQSDYAVENASFLRMENITLGYNAGKFLGERTNLNVSLAVQNAFVITDYKGLDPEVYRADDGIFGIDNTIYPRARTYTLGVNVSF